MRFTVYLFGREVFKVAVSPYRPATAPVVDSERPTIEATSGGDFGFGPLAVLDERRNIT